MKLIQQSPFTPPKLRGVFYGWWLVGISGLVMTLATVPLFHAMSVWAVALEQHFHWSRGELGLALTFTRIEGGIMGPIEGYLTDKLGARRMVLIGLLILGVGFVLLSQVHSLFTFYAAFMVMALGQGLGSWLPLMTTLNQWFAKRRAMAMGWSNVGSRLGALLLVPAIAWAVAPEYDRLGGLVSFASASWQLTAMALGALVLILAVPLSSLIRNRPQDYGQYPDGIDPTSQLMAVAGSETQAPSSAAQDYRSTDLTASQAIRTSAFWFIAIGHGFTSMIILAIFAHLGLLLQDYGYDVQTTGWVVTVYTAVAMVFQLVGGYVGDRMPKRIALFIFTSIQAAGVLVLTVSSILPMFYGFAVLFGMGFGGRNPLTTAIRGEYFGRASFGKILGLSTVPMNVLLLVASPFAGYMRDIQGSYSTAFLVLGILNFLGGVLFLMAKNPVPFVATPAPTTANESG